MTEQAPVPVVMQKLTGSRTGLAVLEMMLADDVDTGDEAAMDAWLKGHRPALYDAYTGRLFDPDAGLTWYETDVKERLGLAGIAAPVRLPGDGALGESCLSAPLMSDLRDLVRAAQRGRDAGAADPLVLDVAAACQFTERDAGGALAAGPRADWLTEMALGDLLTMWQFVFARALDAAVPGSSGTTIMLQLFRGPLPAGALAGPDPEVTGRQLAALERIGALRVTGGLAVLEPLGLLAVTLRLEACGVYVPRLASDGELSASEIVMLAAFSAGLEASPDITAELDAWVKRRKPVSAARELLAMAGTEQTLVRVYAARFVAVRFGTAAETAWEEVLGQKELACYAKKMLARAAAERHPGRPQPRELMLTFEDGAWLVADACGVAEDVLGPDSEMPIDLPDLIGPRLAAQPRLLCEAIARLPRPDARDALVMLGRSENKKLARAARDTARAGGGTGG